MEDHFRKHLIRQVAKDRSVSLGGRLYKAPVDLISERVTLLYHDHDPARIEIVLDGVSHGFLVRLDLHINGRVRRERQGIEIVVATPQAESPSYTGEKLFGGSDDQL